MHKNRRWCLRPVATPEDLARMLTTQTWTLCTGFYVEGYPNYLFLNDATHEDGAGEYGVVKGPYGASLLFQVESITFSWCTPAAALRSIQEALAGRMDDSNFARPVMLRLETPEQHRCCRLCE